VGPFIIRRLLVGIPVIIGITLMVFLVLLVMPGNPAELIQGEMANPEVTAALMEDWGLDQPPPVRLQRWAASLAKLDLGESLVTGRPVVEMLLPRLAWSAYIGVFGLCLGLLIGLPIGIVSAVRPNSIIDYASILTVLLGLSVPTFIVGLLLQLVLAYKLHLFPISGAPPSLGDPSVLYHAVLPAVAIATYQAAIVARVTRTTLLDVLHTDYIRTAYSRGLAERAVIWGHALPNVMVAVVTLTGVNLKSVISGLLIVEIVFSWPGVGRLFYDAVRQRDYPVIQGVALTIAIGVYVINMLADLLYVYIDPRIRVESGQH